MKRNVYLKHSLLIATASVLLLSVSARADDGAAKSDTDESGFTILSNSTNVTRWGLGAGVGIEPSPYVRGDTKYTPIPLIYFDDKWLHAYGTTIDLKIGTWSKVSVALRGYYALADGYRNDDASILNGMENRSPAFWYGPAFSWNTVFGTLSADYLLGGNRGERAKVDYGKSLDFGMLSVEPYGSVEWFSNDYVNYYYGVRASEARAGHPEYSGTSAYAMSLGTKIKYSVTRQQTVTLDVAAEHFTSGIADSPIVGRRYVPTIRLGYLYQFN